MRPKYLCVVVALILLIDAGVQGQQPSKDPSIRELKEQLVKLQSLEANEALPADVKDLNRRFIEQRRTQLRALLQKNIDELRNYRATAGSILSADEIKVLDTMIAQRQNELETEQAVTSSEPPAASGNERAAVADSVSTHSAFTATANPMSSLVSATAKVGQVEFSGSVSPPAEPAAPAPAPIATQDLVLKGSDPSSNDVIKDDIRKELADLTSIRQTSNSSPRLDCLREKAI